RLEYRGYDSAGIAVIDDAGQLQFRKTVGKVKSLHTTNGPDFPRGCIGLGHTRWATHGKPSELNAHPHTDCHHQIAVVHNGIVENFLELKQSLQARGHHFTSETDTETIAHSIEEGLDAGLNFPDSVRRLGRLLKGSQAIAATMCGQSASGGQLCALRLGHAGGIVVAHRDGIGIVASDLPAVAALLGQDSKLAQVGYLEDGEMAVITRAGVQYLDLDGRAVQKQLRTVGLEELLVDKGGYRHFMLKEIMEQPQAVTSVLRERVDFEAGRVEIPDFPLSQDGLRQLRRVVLLGCGTSLYAAQVGRYLIERLAGLPAEAESASEFRYRNAYMDRQTLVVAISQSGETADTVAAMEEVRQKGGRLVTICNVEGSQAARLAEGSLYMGSGIEIGVGSTKTFVASLTILNLLAAYLGQERGFLSG
ncbi:MAG: glutamine--fructose-6-phosphate transaminase (isomerizing), partial [Patescibacteria group bacterium]